MKPPNIAINAQLLSLQQSYRSAGISWYIYNLLNHLPLVQSQFQYTAYVNERGFSPRNGLIIRRNAFPLWQPTFRILWEQMIQPVQLLRQKTALLHSPSFVTPFFCQCPMVVTVHDLAFKRFASILPKRQFFVLDHMLRVSIHRAKMIIAVSNCTKLDLMQFYKVAENKIRTVYHGIDDQFHVYSAEKIDSFRREKQLPETFIFRLGTLEPRKNVESLINAYRIYRDVAQDIPRLYIGGGKGWYYETIFDLVKQYGLEKHIVFAGYIPQGELASWYNAAKLFVYPSLYEGFGMPILEAMACGTPVISSNVSAIPEVAGDAALLVDPNDDEELAHAIRTVIENPQKHKKMRTMGLNQAAKFTWESTAKQTVQAYQNALEK